MHPWRVSSLGAQLFDADGHTIDDGCLVHTPSSNASDRPRFMLAKDIFTTMAQTRLLPTAAAVK
jgi:hypothetical protein